MKPTHRYSRYYAILDQLAWATVHKVRNINRNNLKKATYWSNKQSQLIEQLLDK